MDSQISRSPNSSRGSPGLSLRIQISGFRSVEKRFVPCYDFIKSMVLSEDKVVTTLKRAPRMLMCDMQTSIAPNIASLRKFGVTQSTVLFLVTDYPKYCCGQAPSLNNMSGKLLTWDSTRRNQKFVHALRVFCWDE
ncbi:hypothetical protein CK203_002819 [Vitis vinifera]|uniref:Uncharacterized protein n=1 Tax=Vitis vinifera TaxID=29760 RepID=A0A438KHW1_VITVI|nr:hypothetical protein CK203_002819 [Vitis vinifera]